MGLLWLGIFALIYVYSQQQKQPGGATTTAAASRGAPGGGAAAPAPAPSTAKPMTANEVTPSQQISRISVPGCRWHHASL